MGQSQSISDVCPEDTIDSIQMQVVRHAKVLSEINALTYEDFKNCLENLNALSRKCIDPNGKQLIFLVKRGSDSSMLWKATVKIACIKVDTSTRKIENYKFLNLKQFLCVFKTFQSHLENLVSSENQRNSRHGSISSLENGCVGGDDAGGGVGNNAINQNITASLLMNHIYAFAANDNSDTGGGELSSPTSSVCSHADQHIDECSICLDRRTEVILPCTHSFCSPCIEQWNVNKKTCPICSEKLESTDDTWVLSDIPGVEEINEEICSEFMNLSKNI